MNERDIFIAALHQRDPAARAAFLDEACGSDVAARGRIEELLREQEHLGSFLERPAQRPEVTRAGEEAQGAGPGTIIGRYKLLQPIGEGGMGTVFMAEQTQPVQRKVAVKIIKPGMGSRQVIARFEAERQALALMDHPNIARVLDAGTTDSGQPYFVMELIKGVPITRYCDEHHLTPRQRLELFTSVCQAIQHAHQKGIIHRDLKPSNVLIAQYDGLPVPKVIDFGVAKATGPKLTDRTLFTEFGAVVGTLEYMSPEQAELNQLDVDTRSDIYALGVLLYELLTGTTPLDRKRLGRESLLEALRLIREEEPPKPSTRLSTTQELPAIAASRGLEAGKLSGVVRGELDWIVMKCLDKDRNRRYETANSLARDVDRYLKGETVTACPPSANYRLRKFVSRNQRALATVLVVAVLLLAALAGSAAWVWQERQEAIRQRDEARDQRKLAEANQRKARQAVNESFTQLSESTLLQEPTLEPLRKKLLLDALRYYEGFVQEHGDNPELLADLVAANMRIVMLSYVLEGDRDWLTPCRRAAELMEELLRLKPDVSALQSLQHGIFRPLGTGLPVPDPDAALRVFEKFCPIWEELIREHPTIPGFQNDLAVAYLGYATIHKVKKDHAAAAATYKKGCDLLRPLAVAYPTVPHYRSSLILGVSLFSEQAFEIGNRSVAEEADRETIALAKKLVEDFPEVAAYQEMLAWGYGLLIDVRDRAGRHQDALEACRQDVICFEKLVRSYPMVARYRNKLLWAQQNLGELLWGMGHQTEATDVYRKCLQAMESMPPKMHPNRWILAWSLATCPDPQLRDPRRAIELCKAGIERDPKADDVWNTLGVALYRAGQWQAAIDALQRSIQGSQGDGYDFLFLAMAQWQKGDKDKAREWYDKAVVWMDKKWLWNREVNRFRAEAEQLMGITKTKRER